MGATAHGIGAATHETFTYDDDGNLLTPNFYDYHVPHAMDLPPLKTAAIESPSPFTPLGTKGMGEGGGAAIHAICAALQDALKADGAPIVSDSCNPHHAGLGADPGSGGGSAARRGRCPHEGRGRAHVRGAARGRLDRAQRPGADGGADARRRVVRGQGRPALEREGADPARPRRPRAAIDFEKLEERELEFASRSAKGNGVGAMINMQTAVHARAEPTAQHARCCWAADVSVAGPVGSMGQRVLQPIVKQQVNAGAQRAREAGRSPRAGRAGADVPAEA